MYQQSNFNTLIKKTKNYILPKNTSAVFLDKDGTIMDGHHYWLNMVRLRSKIILRYLDKSKDSNLKNKIEFVLGIDHKLNKMKKNGPVGVMPKKYNISVLLEEMNKWGYKIPYEKYEEIFNEADTTSLNKLNDFTWSQNFFN